MVTAGTMNLEFGVGAWSVEMHETVSCASQSFVAASRVSAMDVGLQRARLAWDLHKLSGKLSNFLDTMYAGMRAAECGKAPQGKAATRDDVEQAQRTLEYLYEITRRVYETSAQKQLTNNSLMSGSLRSIRKRSEELMDLADWLNVSLQGKAKELDALYSEARADLAKGEVFSLV